MTVPPPLDPQDETSDTVVNAANAAAPSRCGRTAASRPHGFVPRGNRIATCAWFATLPARASRTVTQLGRAGEVPANAGVIPGLDRQACQQIPATLGALRVAQHVITPGDELHRRAEISCAACHRVGDRRCDE